METSKIEPHLISKPIQLVAAVLTFTLAVDVAFLTAAASLESPSWLPALLAIAAVVNVPLTLGFVFVLQTRYRAELLADGGYERLVSARRELDKTLDLNHITVEASLRPEGRPELGEGALEEISRLRGNLESAVRDEQRDPPAALHSELADSTLALARAAVAEQDWRQAAHYFAEYLSYRPADWEARFARAAALANERGGEESNRAALAELELALSVAPEDAPQQLIARMWSYRSGFLKRLGRRSEATQAAERALSLAAPGSYEHDDALYNLACLRSLDGDPAGAVELLSSVQDARFVLAAAAHRDDYFSGMADDPTFKALIEKALSAPAPGVRSAALYTSDGDAGSQ